MALIIFPEKVIAMRNVPKKAKAELTRKISECKDICLVYPEAICPVPIWFWSKSDYYFVRIKINDGSQRSFYVLEMSEEPPTIPKEEPVQD